MANTWGTSAVKPLQNQRGFFGGSLSAKLSKIHLLTCRNSLSWSLLVVANPHSHYVAIGPGRKVAGSENHVHHVHDTRVLVLLQTPRNPELRMSVLWVFFHGKYIEVLRRIVVLLYKRRSVFFGKPEWTQFVRIALDEDLHQNPTIRRLYLHFSS